MLFLSLTGPDPTRSLASYGSFSFVRCPRTITILAAETARGIHSFVPILVAHIDHLLLHRDRFHKECERFSETHGARLCAFEVPHTHDDEIM
jgi:hypothetical protein